MLRLIDLMVYPDKMGTPHNAKHILVHSVVTVLFLNEKKTCKKILLLQKLGYHCVQDFKEACLLVLLIVLKIFAVV